MITPLVVATLPVSSNSVSAAGPSDSRAAAQGQRADRQRAAVGQGGGVQASQQRRAAVTGRSLPGWVFSPATAPAASPRGRTEFGQASAFSRVLATTYLVAAFMGGNRVAVGQACPCGDEVLPGAAAQQHVPGLGHGLCVSWRS